MASFVTEVLAHTGSLEKEDLGTRISHLTRRVEEIKAPEAVLSVTNHVNGTFMDPAFLRWIQRKKGT